MVIVLIGMQKLNTVSLMIILFVGMKKFSIVSICLICTVESQTNVLNKCYFTPLISYVQLLLNT